MDENIDFETTRQHVIDTFDALKKRKAFLNDAEEALNVQNILRTGEYFFSKSQLVELSCLINTLLFNYLCYVTVDRFEQLEKMMEDDIQLL
jgi:hypothetical protein